MRFLVVVLVFLLLVLALAVAHARASAQAHRGDDPRARQGYEDALGGAVRETLVRAEAYPELRASEGFLRLQHDLTDTGGPDRRRPAVPQRQRAGLQHPRSHLPVQPGGGPLRVRGRRLLRAA